jgi:hypothetical protein
MTPASRSAPERTGMPMSVWSEDHLDQPLSVTTQRAKSPRRSWPGHGGRFELVLRVLPVPDDDFLYGFSRPTPSAGADSEKSSGPPRCGQRRGNLIEVGRRRPAASWTRGVTATPRRSGVRAAVAELLCLRRGAPAPDGQDPHLGGGAWVVAQSHPAPVNPGASRADTARAASAHSNVARRSTWRPGRRPAPQVGVDGEWDGIVRRGGCSPVNGRRRR